MHPASKRIKNAASVTSAVAVVLTACTMVIAVPARAQQPDFVELIYQTEADYPPADEIRGPTPGPVVEVVSPPRDVPQRSPIRLNLRFSSFGGTSIDLDSIRLIYEKRPEVELTSRVLPYVGAKAIVINKAKVPAGTHTIRVLVKNTAERLGVSHFTFTIIK